MTVQEVESIRLRRLIAEIHRDLEALEQICHRSSEFYAQLGTQPDAHEKMTLAGYLHHFYTGVETIHERIVQVLEGEIAHSPQQWHRDLLEDMALEVGGVRPGVISPATKNQLVNYLGFRHVFRHAYTTDLDWTRLQPLVQQLEAIFRRYRSELTTFITWLSSAADILNDKPDHNC